MRLSVWGAWWGRGVWSGLWIFVNELNLKKVEAEKQYNDLVLILVTTRGNALSVSLGHFLP